MKIGRFEKSERTFTPRFKYDKRSLIWDITCGNWSKCPYFSFDWRNKTWNHTNSMASNYTDSYVYLPAAIRHWKWRGNFSFALFFIRLRLVWMNTAHASLGEKTFIHFMTMDYFGLIQRQKAFSVKFLLLFTYPVLSYIYVNTHGRYKTCWWNTEYYHHYKLVQSPSIY